MSPLVLTYLIVIPAVVLIGTVIATLEQVYRRKRERARNELLSYLGMSWNDYDDPNLKITERAARLSDILIEEAHGRARRGIYLVDKLLNVGAITIPKRNEAHEFFLTYLTEKDRKATVPAHLPDMAIEAHCDHDADSAEKQWATFVEDCRILRHHITHTFPAAYPFADSVPEKVWEQ